MSAANLTIPFPAACIMTVHYHAGQGPENQRNKDTLHGQTKNRLWNKRIIYSGKLKS